MTMFFCRMISNWGNRYLKPLHGGNMRLITVLLALLIVSCASKNDEQTAIQKKAEIYYNQGTQELVSKNYTKALKHLLQANSLKENDSRILNNLGMTYFFKKRPQLAISYIKKSIKINPKFTKARLNLATIYMNNKNYKLAKNQYDLILDDLTYEGQFLTYYNLGLLNMKQGRDNEAVNYLKQSLNENKTYCASHFLLGKIYFKRGEYQQALKSYKSSGYGICYNNPKPIYHQALSYIKLKEYDTAKMKLEEIVERFSLTKYERMANKRLQTLNTIIEKSEDNYNFSNSSKRNILSPDF